MYHICTMKRNVQTTADFCDSSLSKSITYKLGTYILHSKHRSYILYKEKKLSEVSHWVGAVDE